MWSSCHNSSNSIPQLPASALHDQEDTMRVKHTVASYQSEICKHYNNLLLLSLLTS